MHNIRKKIKSTRLKPRRPPKAPSTLFRGSVTKTEKKIYAKAPWNVLKDAIQSLKLLNFLLSVIYAILLKAPPPAHRTQIERASEFCKTSWTLHLGLVGTSTGAYLRPSQCE